MRRFCTGSWILLCKYMTQPDGFNTGRDKVCKLKKSIYGLRQASECWYETFDKFLKDSKFNNCVLESCLYFRFLNGKITFLLVYVNDLILACNDTDELN